MCVCVCVCVCGGGGGGGVCVCVWGGGGVHRLSHACSRSRARDGRPAQPQLRRTVALRLHVERNEVRPQQAALHCTALHCTCERAQRERTTHTVRNTTHTVQQCRIAADRRRHGHAACKQAAHSRRRAIDETQWTTDSSQRGALPQPRSAPERSGASRATKRSSMFSVAMVSAARCSAPGRS